MTHILLNGYVIIMVQGEVVAYIKGDKKDITRAKLIAQERINEPKEVN